MTRGRLGRLADPVCVVRDPLGDAPGFGDPVDPEHRGAGHPGVGDTGGCAAGTLDCRETAVDTGNERALGRGERQIVLARGGTTVDGDRAGDTHRELCPSDEVLGVRFGGLLGREPERAERVEIGIGFGCKKRPARRGGSPGVGVVVELVEPQVAGVDTPGEVGWVCHDLDLPPHPLNATGVVPSTAPRQTGRAHGQRPNRLTETQTPRRE